MKMVYLAVTLVIMSTIAGLTGACTAAPSPSAALTSSPTAVATSAAATVAANQGWQQKWDTTVAAAKKEGTVRIYTVWTPEVTRPMREAFFNKFGIELEFASLNMGAALLPKLQAEKAAGLYVADAFGIGTNTLVSEEKAAGLLGPIEPLLILPDVTDVKMWRNGQFPYMDKAKLVVGFTAGIERYMLYNTTMVKEGEITSYKDLLKPQYKGQIVMTDPANAGPANSIFSYLADDRVWGLDAASQWLRDLLTKQEMVVQANERLATEWTARGKYPLCLAAHPASTVEFIRAGAPIALAVPIEGQPMTAAGGGLGVPTKSERPNAQAVFVNWLLTNEGQTIFSKGYGRTSARLDVATDFIPPTYIPGPNEKGFAKTEEYLAHEAAMRGVAKRIEAEAGVAR